MTNDARTPLLLFGAPVGLYTGKIRSYLRKQGIPYCERLPSDPVFQKELLPKLQRFINPVIRTADGTVVQDTADIIDFCEAAGLARTPSTPVTPLQRVVALVLDLFGGEGLVRPAMHYRWSYRKENDAFLRHEFGLTYRPGRQPPELVERKLGEFMNYLAAYIPKFGITAATVPAIEASYEAFLAVLDAHFRAHPYVLGGVPCIADYGLMAPLYAHLARDPVPSNLMKLRAPSVFRWTERMNAADPDVPEFPRYPASLPAEDAVPETLWPILAFIASDWLPEVQAGVAAIDTWLAARADSDLARKPIERMLCDTTFSLRGVTVTSGVQPYTLYKLQRVTDAYASLAGAERERVGAALAQAGLAPLLTLGASRRVERRDFLEWWAAPRSAA
jgi:glutathione S-transferase